MKSYYNRISQKNMLAASLLAMALLLSSCELTKNVSAPPPGVIRFKLNVSYVEVKEKNAKGESWDPGLSREGLAPDLYYTVSIGYEKKFESKVVEDKYITQWLEPSDFLDVPKGQQVVLTFYDSDMSLVRTGVLNNPDDYLGAVSMPVEELLKAAQDGKTFTFESVIKCKVNVSNVMR
jgi:hypothetical protein